MHERLKSWESPRRQGRNEKGKGGAARQRQLRKQTQMLRQKLKDQNKDQNKDQLPDQPGDQQNLQRNQKGYNKLFNRGKEIQSFPLFFLNAC